MIRRSGHAKGYRMPCFLPPTLPRICRLALSMIMIMINNNNNNNNKNKRNCKCEHTAFMIHRWYLIYFCRLKCKFALLLPLCIRYSLDNWEQWHHSFNVLFHYTASAGWYLLMRPDLHFYQLCTLPFVRGAVVKEQSSLRSYFCVTLRRSCETLQHLTITSNARQQ